jgi:hypothetical protein
VRKDLALVAEVEDRPSNYPVFASLLVFDDFPGLVANFVSKSKF